RDELGLTVHKALAARFPAEHLPAVSLVTTALGSEGALVALDAIATADVAGSPQIPNAALLPAGTRLYVSGQAQPAPTLREATRKTLESLTATLKHCGRSDADVVQVKCFFKPMRSIAEVRDEIARYYGDRTPPVSYVEWKL